MRLDPKYFIPFLLVIAAICVLAIIFFNFRFLGDQTVRFAERVGDGSELFNHEFEEYFTGEIIRPADFENEKIIALFWATWSNRSLTAQAKIIDLLENTDNSVVLLLMAVKDNEMYLNDFRHLLTDHIILLNATEFYNDARLPGMPAVVAYSPDGSIYGMKLGYTGADDYHFLENFLNN